jgi:hypothetical protein
MPLTLDQSGLRVLVEDLLGRRVRHRTLAGTMDFLRRFGTYIGIDEQLRADIDDERRYWLREYADDAKIKELFLLRSGLRLEDLVAVANRLSQRASTARSRRDAVAGWNAAALIILQLCRPLRLQDTMGLRLHRDLVRDSEGWTFDELVTRKAKVPVDERLWPIATPFLDELILLGRDESQLWRRYADLVGAPLFRRSDGEPYAARWASQVFQREFGTGVHITRTLLHDHAAGHGPNGVRQAMALAGQIGARTAEEYQTSATRRRAVREGQARMGTLLDAALA